ncbi:hypothetical protein BGX30_006194, partial [Mortierella sp. GBA39]
MLRKRRFTDVKAGLKSSFHWPLRSRQEFANYMRLCGWTVVVCRTEANLAIAMDAQDIDVIILKDSDMMAYQSVATLWRPVSNNLILVYKIPDVLATLKIVTAYLTHGQAVVKNTKEELNKWKDAEIDWAVDGVLRSCTRKSLFCYGNGKFRTGLNLASMHESFKGRFAQK